MNNKPIKYKIKRLFHGFASVRDYVVQKCKDENRNLAIFLGDRYMIVKWEDLGRGLPNKDVFYSKQTNSKYKSYTLIDFDWKPMPVEQKLFDL
jgi:hypothetical protein